ncbi:MAG: Crp/Fnr family transcriptional regulator [Steroidobacteraceae bacterium]
MLTYRTAQIAPIALMGSSDARLAASAADGPHQNSLLASLPAEDYDRLAPSLQSVNLEAGQLLNEQGNRQHHVYFPVSAVLSLQHVLEDGSTSEIASIGHEGLFGASLFLGDTTPSSQALVQHPGRAYRGTAQRVLAEFQRGAAFQRLVLSHVQTLFMQVAQTSACNRSHTVEQRLCRWLLGILERGTALELIATHERLGCILGVRRESVTETAGHLQKEGAIRYRRGRLSVLAPSKLKLRTCGCYTALRLLYERSHA